MYETNSSKLDSLEFFSPENTFVSASSTLPIWQKNVSYFCRKSIIEVRIIMYTTRGGNEDGDLLFNGF